MAKPDTTIPPIIARCQRCGRGFLSWGADGDMIDHWPSRDPRVSPAECGGRIVRLAEPESNTQ